VGRMDKENIVEVFFSHGAGASDRTGNVKWWTETYFVTAMDHTCSNIISREDWLCSLRQGCTMVKPKVVAAMT
jgi:hypothetical protein